MSRRGTETLRVTSLRKKDIQVVPASADGQNFEAVFCTEHPVNGDRSMTTMRKRPFQIIFQTRRHLPKPFIFLPIANGTLHSEEIESQA